MTEFGLPGLEIQVSNPCFGAIEIFLSLLLLTSEGNKQHPLKILPSQPKISRFQPFGLAGSVISLRKQRTCRKSKSRKRKNTR